MLAAPDLALINRIQGPLVKQTMNTRLSKLGQAMLPELPMVSILGLLPEEARESLRRMSHPKSLKIQRQMDILYTSSLFEAQLKEMVRRTTLTYAPSIDLISKISTNLYGPSVISSSAIKPVVESVLKSMGMSNVEILSAPNVESQFIEIDNYDKNSKLEVVQKIDPSLKSMRGISDPELQLRMGLLENRVERLERRATSNEILAETSRKNEMSSYKRDVAFFVAGPAYQNLFDSAINAITNLPPEFIIVLLNVACFVMTGYYPIV